MEYQNEKLEFAESAVDYFHQKSMKKDKEIQHLEKEIGRLRRLKGASEEKKATCKPMGKGRKCVCIRRGSTEDTPRGDFSATGATPRSAAQAPPPRAGPER